MTAYYSAAFCFILLLVCNGKVIDNPLQDDEFERKYLGERYKRAVSLPPPKCNVWSDWINSNHPANGTDEVEVLNPSQLDSICPSKIGGNITQLRCTDDQGESFQNKVNETSGDSKYLFTCNAPKDGATCHIITSNGQCPDYKISFMCTCPSTTASPVSTAGSNPNIGPVHSIRATTVTFTTATTPSAAATAATTTTSSGKSTTQKTHLTPLTSTPTEQSPTSNGTVRGTQRFEGSASNNYTIGNSNVPWWLIPVLVAAMLFIINVIIAICLYKKSRKQIEQTVHPMLPERIDG